MLSQLPCKERPVTFRCFNRRGYALFACLGREVRIGVLSAATLCCAAPALASRESGGDGAERLALALEADTLETPLQLLAADTRLAEASVSAQRAALPRELAARPVMTLTRRELDAAGVTSINDVLKLAAGVDVRQRGAFGVQADISLDGGTFDQACILIDGVGVTNPQTGHNAADFPLNLSDIDRIEIVRGAASRVFGSQAFSGAINIVTRHAAEASPRSVDAHLAAGSFGTFEAEARYGVRMSKHFSSSVSASFRRSDGATANSDFRTAKAFWSGRYADEALRVNAQAALTSTRFGANTFYSGAYPNQWEATDRYLLSLKAETRGRISLAPSVSWLRSVDHFQLVRNTHFGENFHRGDVYTAGLAAHISSAYGRTALGAEIREESILSTNLGHELEQSAWREIHGEDSLFYTRRDERTNVSFFAEHNVVLKRFTLSAGVLAQRGTSSQRGYRFYPGIDVSWRPNGADAEGLRLFASWNRSMRLPTFTDLWYRSATQEGNSTLRPEECTAWRLGAQWQRGGFSAEAEVHFNQGTHMIDWVMRSADDIYHATSFSLNNAGVSAAFGADFARICGTARPFVKRLRLDYAYLYQHRRSGEAYFKSNYALEYLRHKLVATLEHRLVGALEAAWSVRLQNREGGYLVYTAAGTNTGELRPYGTHAIVDLRLRLPLKTAAGSVTLFADAQNLTAHSYYDLGNVRQPRAVFMAGVNYRL